MPVSVDRADGSEDRKRRGLWALGLPALPLLLTLGMLAWAYFTPVHIRIGDFALSAAHYEHVPSGVIILPLDLTIGLRWYPLCYVRLPDGGQFNVTFERYNVRGPVRGGSPAGVPLVPTVGSPIGS